MRCILLSCLISVAIWAQDSSKVTFRIQANNIPDSAKVYITGNTKELGNWRPGEVSLINTSGNFWERSFNLPRGKALEYKITLGSWKTEAVMSNGGIPQNSKLIIEQDTVVESVVDNWKHQFKKYEIKSQITGKLDYYRNVKGKGLLPRNIIVWLPPDYNKDVEKRYPVLYMQDGQNLFDASTSAYGIEWHIDETADSLIRNGEAEPIIIVGLANTRLRSAEYGDNDTGLAYMRFVVDKVKPFIDSTYRTLKGPEYTAVGGSSQGALISFMLGWNYPDVFSKIMCLSPALKIYNIDYVKTVQKYRGVHKNLKFYFDAGQNSIDSLLIPGTQEMITALEMLGYKTGEDILWYRDKEGLHSEASWGKRVWRPLLFFFGK